MTQHKVISEDSLSAMDEISKVLGKDAVILKTTKVNGKIEILGSNNIEDIASSNAKKSSNKNQTLVIYFQITILNRRFKIGKLITYLMKKN